MNLEPGFDIDELLRLLEEDNIGNLPTGTPASEPEPDSEPSNFIDEGQDTSTGKQSESGTTNEGGSEGNTLMDEYGAYLQENIRRGEAGEDMLPLPSHLQEWVDSGSPSDWLSSEQRDEIAQGMNDIFSGPMFEGHSGFRDAFGGGQYQSVMIPFLVTPENADMVKQFAMGDTDTNALYAEYYNTSPEAYANLLTDKTSRRVRSAGGEFFSRKEAENIGKTLKSKEFQNEIDNYAKFLMDNGLNSVQAYSTARGQVFARFDIPNAVKLSPTEGFILNRYDGADNVDWEYQKAPEPSLLDQAIKVGIIAVGTGGLAAGFSAALASAGLVAAGSTTATALGSALASATVTGVQGGDFDDILKSFATAGVLSSAGSYLLDVSGAEGLIANNVDSEALQNILRGSLQNGTRSALGAVINGEDPLKAFATGGISGAVGATLGQLSENQEWRAKFGDTWNELPDAVKAVAEDSIARVLTGQEVNQDTVAQAVTRAIIDTELVTDLVGELGIDLRDDEGRWLASTLQGVVGAAVTGEGGRIPDVLKNSLLEFGKDKLKQFGATAELRKAWETDSPAGREFTRQKLLSEAKFKSAAGQLDAEIMGRLEAEFGSMQFDDATINQLINRAKYKTYQDQIAAEQKEWNTANSDRITMMYENAQSLFSDNFTAEDWANLDANDQTRAKWFVSDLMGDSFDPEQYAKIHGLAEGEDPYTHFVSQTTRGKRLFGNYDELGAAQNRDFNTALNAVLGAQGVDPKFINQLSTDARKRLYDKAMDLSGGDPDEIESLIGDTDFFDAVDNELTTYANDLGLKDKFKQIGIDEQAYNSLSPAELLNQAQNQSLVDFKNTDIDTTGLSDEQLQSGNFIQVVNANGGVQWVSKTDGGQYWDDENGLVKITTGEDGKTVIQNNSGQVIGEVNGQPLDTADVFRTLYTESKQRGIDAIQTARTMEQEGRLQEGALGFFEGFLKYAQENSSDAVLNGVANTYRALGGVTSSLSGISRLFGTDPDSTVVKQFADAFADMGSRYNTEEYKKSVEKMYGKMWEDIDEEFKDEGWATRALARMGKVAEGIATNPLTFASEVLFVEGVEEVLPWVIGGGVGAGAKVLGKAASKYAGLTAAAAAEVGESFGSGYNDTRERMRNTLIQQRRLGNNTYSDEQIEQMSDEAGLQNGMLSAGVTLGTMGVGGLAFEKIMTGGRGDASGMLERAYDGMKAVGFETVQEFVEEGAQSGHQAYIVANKNPKAGIDAVDEAAFGAFLGAVTGGSLSTIAIGGKSLVNGAQAGIDASYEAMRRFGVTSFDQATKVVDYVKGKYGDFKADQDIKAVFNQFERDIEAGNLDDFDPNLVFGTYDPAENEYNVSGEENLTADEYVAATQTAYENALADGLNPDAAMISAITQVSDANNVTPQSLINLVGTAINSGAESGFENYNPNDFGNTDFYLEYDEGAEDLTNLLPAPPNDDGPNDDNFIDEGQDIEDIEEGIFEEIDPEPVDPEPVDQPPNKTDDTRFNQIFDMLNEGYDLRISNGQSHERALASTIDGVEGLTGMTEQELVELLASRDIDLYTDLAAGIVPDDTTGDDGEDNFIDEGQVIDDGNDGDGSDIGGDVDPGSGEETGGDTGTGGIDNDTGGDIGTGDAGDGLDDTGDIGQGTGDNNDTGSGTSPVDNPNETITPDTGGDSTFADPVEEDLGDLLMQDVQQLFNDARENQDPEAFAEALELAAENNDVTDAVILQLFDDLDVENEVGIADTFLQLIDPNTSDFVYADYTASLGEPQGNVNLSEESIAEIEQMIGEGQELVINEVTGQIEGVVDTLTGEIVNVGQDLQNEIDLTNQNLANFAGDTQSNFDQINSDIAGLEQQLGDTQDLIIDSNGQILGVIDTLSGQLVDVNNNLQNEINITNQNVADLAANTQSNFDVVNQNLTDLATNTQNNFDITNQNVLDLAANTNTRFNQVDQNIADLAASTQQSFADIEQRLDANEQLILDETGRIMGVIDTLSGQIVEVNTNLQNEINLTNQAVTALADVTQQGFNQQGQAINNLASSTQQGLNSLASQTQQGLTNLATNTQQGFNLQGQAITNLANATQQGFEQQTDALIALEQQTNQNLEYVYDQVTGQIVGVQNVVTGQITDLRNDINNEFKRQEQQKIALENQRLEAEWEASAEEGFAAGFGAAQGEGMQVITPEGKPLEYLYDFDSIFANPDQENLFTTPYAQNTLVNTGGRYGQYMYKEGGLVNNDLNDLIRIIEGK